LSQEDPVAIPVTTTCKYVARVIESGSYAKHIDLWEYTASFLLGGSEESYEIDRSIAGISAELQRCVERVLQISKGRVGSLPQSPEK
jgi:hypothetical protein